MLDWIISRQVVTFMQQDETSLHFRHRHRRRRSRRRQSRRRSSQHDVTVVVDAVVKVRQASGRFFGRRGPGIQTLAEGDSSRVDQRAEVLLEVEAEWVRQQ